MIAFIDDQRGIHGVEPICKVLPIAPSTYHAHIAQRRNPLRLSTRVEPTSLNSVAEFPQYLIKDIIKYMQQEKVFVQPTGAIRIYVFQWRG